MLEEYEKSLIANNAYIERIMQIIYNAKSSKLIRAIDGKSILQISDSEETVNIYNRRNLYCINLDGTNFNSIIGYYDNCYLYKNKKLEIDCKLNKCALGDIATKKTIQTKLKNYTSSTSYIDDDDELLLIYSSLKIGDEPEYTVYDKELIDINDEVLSQFIIARRKEQEKYDDNNNEKTKLPRRVEDFDYSSFEDEENDEFSEEYSEEISEISDDEDSELEQILDEIQEDENTEDSYGEMENEEQFEDLEEYYKDFVVLIDDKESDNVEKTHILQTILDETLIQEDENFCYITEVIDMIFATYETEIVKLKPKKESSDFEK